MHQREAILQQQAIRFIAFSTSTMYDTTYVLACTEYHYSLHKRPSSREKGSDVKLESILEEIEIREQSNSTAYEPYLIFRQPKHSR